MSMILSKLMGGKSADVIRHRWNRSRGVGRGGSEGSDDPPFLGANFIHFLYKVLVERSMQK